VTGTRNSDNCAQPAVRTAKTIRAFGFWALGLGCGVSNDDGRRRVLELGGAGERGKTRQRGHLALGEEAHAAAGLGFEEALASAVAGVAVHGDVHSGVRPSVAQLRRLDKHVVHHEVAV
jgi:hypothetical protein